MDDINLLNPEQSSIQFRNQVIQQSKLITTRNPTNIELDGRLIRLDLENVKLLEERVPIGNLKNLFDIYLYGVKQPDFRYQLYQDGTTLKVIFMDDITRVPGEIDVTAFDIVGKLKETQEI